MTNHGQHFRQAWINAVNQHHPTTPPPTYLTPWNTLATWEQHTCEATYTRILDLITSSKGNTTRLHAFERGQILTATWNAHVYYFHPDPGPSYTTPWNDLPTWRRDVNTDIFETIARTHQEHP